ncbi:hypothetical protein H0A64_08255 [Alcaligenaceae bacterium]|nr:hypothetical protein [Alcaligenaceae bacterium]
MLIASWAGKPGEAIAAYEALDPAPNHPPADVLDAPSVYKFVNFKDLLEIEAGVTSNEPTQLCVKEAIEAAVIHLTVEGLKDGNWRLKNEEDWYSPLVQTYLKESNSWAVTTLDAQALDQATVAAPSGQDTGAGTIVPTPTVDGVQGGPANSNP